MEYTLKELEEWNVKIEKKATEFGLDYYPQEFEIVGFNEMLAYEAYVGMPSKYPHWSYGKAYEKSKTLYSLNLTGLPYEMVYRQPFPGPGLGVRCLGAITRDRLEAVRESDAILREEFQIAGLDKKVWQYFTVVPDFKSVGVRDNARSFDWPVIIRAVNTVDAMTATIEPIDWPVLMKITDRILKEVKNVNRVCYDMSPKPNATIEWE